MDDRVSELEDANFQLQHTVLTQRDYIMGLEAQISNLKRQIERIQDTHDQELEVHREETQKSINHELNRQRNEYEKSTTWRVGHTMLRPLRAVSGRKVSDRDE